MIPYVTALGAWGDVIAAYGNICHFLKEQNYEKCKVIYFGFYKEICEFLKAQIEIEDVIHIIPKNETEFIDFVRLASNLAVDWNVATGIKEEIFITHITKHHLIDNPKDIHRQWCALPKDIKIPEYEQPKRPILMFQPYSTQSVSTIDHWPFWLNALEWLSTLKYHIIVVGEKNGGLRGGGFRFPKIELPNTTDLVGKTKSMMEVLALANHSNGIITTSNCLSMWSIIRSLPALVVCNKLNLTHAYYNGWINHPKNEILGVNVSLKTFKTTFTAWEDKYGLSLL